MTVKRQAENKRMRSSHEEVSMDRTIEERMTEEEAEDREALVKAEERLSGLEDQLVELRERMTGLKQPADTDYPDGKAKPGSTNPHHKYQEAGAWFRHLSTLRRITIGFLFAATAASLGFVYDKIDSPNEMIYLIALVNIILCVGVFLQEGRLYRQQSLLATYARGEEKENGPYTKTRVGSKLGTTLVFLAACVLLCGCWLMVLFSRWSDNLSFPDGNVRYEGEFKDGKQDGQGTEYYANGDRYEGMWSEDRAVGGWRYFTNGTKEYGHWDEDGKWVAE